MVHINLRKIRLAKGVTQLHIAKKLNVTSMTYSRLESGESKIDVERLRVIAKALDVEVHIFFDSELTDSVVKNYAETSKEVI